VAYLSPLAKSRTTPTGKSPVPVAIETGTPCVSTWLRYAGDRIGAATVRACPKRGRQADHAGLRFEARTPTAMPAGRPTSRSRAVRPHVQGGGPWLDGPCSMPPGLRVRCRRPCSPLAPPIGPYRSPKVSVEMGWRRDIVFKASVIRRGIGGEEGGEAAAFLADHLPREMRCVT
jgi:hypothetical protein